MLKSANQPYDQAGFHEQLVKLAGVGSSSRVLDVGCGTGRTLRQVARVAQQAIGIDSKEEFLEQARRSLSDAVDDRRVELLNVDLNREALPFPDAGFDNIICQNVLECIEDKQRLIAGCHRVLKPDGVFLLAHHDFGGVMVNSGDSGLTRAIVAAYADEAQGWMDAADGEIGRKLPGFMRASEFGEMTSETQQLVAFRFAEGSAAHDYCADAAKAAIRAGISKSDVDGWFADLAALDRREAFYFSIPWVYVKASK
ncbi:methyltransferase domain-containing protein [Pelagibius litoralis]|uniref:Methyltransferase domain-containing protein n=1 Tax=Pelagibius litoralis TaxID=374515 RepID=A0A967EZ42_9PROT|nr:methyltransferase domain-containing protein [Pelagibius litoralis]NIA70073.1 methyltransferase domain-containing protein [Pelagibius litoralis]